MAMVGDRHRAGDSQPDERSCADAGRGEDQVSYGVDEGEGALLRLKFFSNAHPSAAFETLPGPIHQ